MQCRLIKDFTFRKTKILFGSFGIHRDWSLCADAQANCSRHTVMLYIFSDPADFENGHSDYGYTSGLTVY